MGNLVQKTLIEHDTFDPVRNLWRNVLVVAIEDAIKIKTTILKFKHFYANQNRRWHELDYVSLPNQDFDSVCYLANLDGNLVRRKVNETLEKQIEILIKDKAVLQDQLDKYIDKEMEKR